MDILVTGATGYVGEAVSTRLVREGHTVTGLTRDASSSRSTTLREAGIRMVSGDVGEPTTYREHLGAADVVVHTVTDSMRPSDADRDLFHELSAVSARGGAPHLIYTTGCSVYGAHSHRVLTEETPTDADHPRATLERELQASGLRHTIVRPAFVFGGDGRSSLLGRWLDADRDDVGMFYGDPTKEWSWVHVDDLARGYAAIVDRLPELDGETFLLADEAPFRALETFEASRRARRRRPDRGGARALPGVRPPRGRRCPESAGAASMDSAGGRRPRLHTGKVCSAPRVTPPSTGTWSSFDDADQECLEDVAVRSGETVEEGLERLERPLLDPRGERVPLRRERHGEAPLVVDGRYALHQAALLGSADEA
jgi:nucleoside-diphosphate-sugar epimerase